MKKVTSKATAASALLESMTRDQLRAVAKQVGTKTGKSVKDTVKNLEKAIADGKLHFKSVCTLSFKPTDGSASRQTYFGKTLRTYVSGPGEANTVWKDAASAPVQGSPSDPEGSN